MNFCLRLQNPLIHHSKNGRSHVKNNKTSVRMREKKTPALVAKIRSFLEEDVVLHF